MRVLPVASFTVVLATIGLLAQQPARPATDVGSELWHHRNLGKALYENPTTQQQAVDELKRALDLDPQSAREQLNYGLALLRAAKTADAIAQLQRVQQEHPELPHTWFNLGIAYKRESQYEKAIEQFEKMVTLDADEPISHYNLGYLYKLTEKPADALRHFERASALDPNLAGAHFQLYNAYREAGRADEAQREQTTFQEIKRRQAGAAIPEDLDWSYYAELLDTLDPALAADSSTPVTPVFVETVVNGPYTGPNAGLSALDVDADGKPDLVVWGVGGVQIVRAGQATATPSGLEALKDVRSVAVGDLNNDGLPDLCVITASGAALYTNRAGSFAASDVAIPAGSYARGVWVDIDHDYDQDLLLVGAQGRLMRNNGQAGFSDQSADFPFAPGTAVDATVLDLINDTTGHDLVVSYEGGAGVLYRDLLAGKFRATPIPALPAGARSLVAEDIDHDGWLDLLAATPNGPVVLRGNDGAFAAVPVPGASGPSRAVALLDVENRGVSELVLDGALRRNAGRGTFAAPYSTAAAGAVALAASDFDADGRTDLAALTPDGAVHRLANTTTTTNTYLRVALTGVRNPKLPVEAQVEVRAGVRYQKKTYTGTPLVFGLRDTTAIDMVRITWPNGLIQNELRQTPGKSVAFREAQRLSGSCPMIYTWDGTSFQFITDVLGVAPLGASAGDGTYFPVDHDEYIQIPGSALKAVDGAYEIRITEELREVSYLDQIQLVAIDHPSNVPLYTNDKFKSPPFPEFRLFGTPTRHHAMKARDDRGRDIRRQLEAIDQTYPDGFTRNYAGVAELHAVELDFGHVAQDNRAVLVLNGWVDWADGSTFIGAAQERPGGLVFPSIQVKDTAGRWVTVVDDMGIPAGKPKTIAVDLTGKFLSASREVRIATSLSLYFDEIALLPSSDAPAHVLTRVDAADADLRYRGFSTPVIHPERLQPERFEYAAKMPLSMWNPTPGLYTRFGEVRPLVTGIDDRFVVMGSGDELRLRFAVASLPGVPAGWTRDFLLLVDGWAKDGDANTAFGQTVEPLPFHGMSAYPYPATEHYPDDSDHAEYRATYNTRPALRLLRPLAPPASPVSTNQ